MTADKPEAMIQRIEKYFRVSEKVTEHIRNIAEKVHGGYVLFETRPYRDDPTSPWSKLPVAKLVLHIPSQRWKLYWHRASGRWLIYSEHAQLAGALKAIKTDRYGCFWG